MTTTSEALSPPRVSEWNGPVEALRATFYLGLREMRIYLRQPAFYIPNLIMPVFFYFVMVGSIQSLARGAGFVNYKAFQLPASIIIAVMSGGAGFNMVLAIESGYFDKLLLTPASRMSILVGGMAADFLRIILQALLVTMIALATGLHFATGIFGAAAMILLASMWGIAYSAIGFGIAIKTGSAQATQGMWALFLPFFFLTTTFAPIEALSGWLKTAATYNPLTYVLRSLRSLSMTGWQFGEILIGLIAVAGLAALSLSYSIYAMKKRVS